MHSRVLEYTHANPSFLLSHPISSCFILHCTHAVFSRYPHFSMAFTLGSCAIWSMHFIGMQAEELKLEPGAIMCYNWLGTIASLLLAVGGVWAGVAVAGWDVFAGDDRIEMLRQFVLHDQSNASAKRKELRAGSRHVHMVALFDMLHWIVAGSLLAAIGALSMHYVGMLSMRGPFRRVWNFPYVALSVFLGVVVCFAGFWILFRPLHWKVEKIWYRPTSAAVIALAVCSLHFFGMKSATYIADSTVDVAEQCIGPETLMGWKPIQLQVLIVAMGVPFVAFCIEHTISSELRETYRQLMDVEMSGSEFKLEEDEEEEALCDEKKSVPKDTALSKSTQESKLSWNGEISGSDGSDASSIKTTSIEAKQSKPSFFQSPLSRIKSSLESEMTIVIDDNDVEEGLSQ